MPAILQICSPEACIAMHDKTECEMLEDSSNEIYRKMTYDTFTEDNIKKNNPALSDTSA